MQLQNLKFKYEITHIQIYSNGIYLILNLMTQLYNPLCKFVYTYYIIYMHGAKCVYYFVLNYFDLTI